MCTKHSLFDIIISFAYHITHIHDVHTIAFCCLAWKTMLYCCILRTLNAGGDLSLSY